MRFKLSSFSIFNNIIIEFKILGISRHARKLPTIPMEFSTSFPGIGIFLEFFSFGNLSLQMKIGMKIGVLAKFSLENRLQIPKNGE